MRWRIYYADGSLADGSGAAEWRAAPEDGVQVVVRFPMLDPLGWACRGVAVRDRDLWTGEDAYDPFGWGAKRGSLIGAEAYFAIWDRACTDAAPVEGVSRGNR